MKDDLLPFYKEREFTLNTTPERLATWLQKHVKAGLVTPPGAKIHIGIAQFTPPPNIGPTARLKIHGYVEKPDPEEDGAYLRSHLPGLIQFELVPSLTIEGVEVRAECHDPALIEYFDELLAKIERSATLTLTRGSADDKRFGEIPTRRGNMDWDVFISHAREDKEDIARPLAEALGRQGLRVWYDEFTLTLGDSLRRSIDHGLAQSRYGIVILSPHFFAKEWPQKELDGLAAREVSGEKVILPIWHNVTADQVRKYSPTLADRVAALSDRGLEHVVEELLRVIRPASEPAHRLRFEKVQYSTEVAQILRRYEGKRIKANREDKHDQYFVHKGRLHLLDVDAARVCDERIGPFEDLDPDEDFVLDIKERKGSPYNRSKMIKVLDSIEAEETKEAEKRQITISLLKQESATSIRLPFEPEMVPVPAGEFQMGTLEADVYATAREHSIERKYIEREVPWHKMFVREFEIGKYPVTNFEYQAFVQDTSHEPPCHWKGDKYPEELRNHPVVNVSWHDAVAYCNWLSKKTGKSYRLPRENEWEKAARGTDGREFPWGNEWDVSKCNTREGGRGTTTPVDQYSPHGDSPYGVVDMAGNVWEWCTDCLGAYKGNPFPDEDYGRTYKVLRGGSWDHGRVGARCAYRNWFEPRNRVRDVGFRCVRYLLPFWQRVLLRLKGLILGRVWLRVLRSSAKHTPAKPRRPVNWEKVGAIAGVIGLLIALGAWLVPNAADFFALPSETPTVTPSDSPPPTPVFTVTPTNMPFPPTATPTLTPVPPTPEPLAGATMIWGKDQSEMVYVPSGEFLMGFSESDVEVIRVICTDCDFSIEGEEPQHKVFLDAFYVDKTEVTNAQYRACVEAGACDVPSDTTYYDKGDHAQYPVVYVSWNDAEAYCQWAGKRLPTEAEWEKAARGDEERTWPWGNIFDGKKVNFCDKNCPESRKDASVDDGYAYTAPVGGYPTGASPYGALDMAGNVWEWVADWYDPSYYSQSPAQNPPGPDSNSDKVVRGGSWRNGFTDIRAGYRYRFVPTLHGEDLGFRCAR